MVKIEGVCKELLEKTEWVAITTWSEKGAHLVGTWGDYIKKIGMGDDSLIIPAGHYNKTEENLKKNKNIQLLIASREVKGTYGPGQGCLICGEGEIKTDGEIVQKVKKIFSWARGALIVKVKEVKLQL